jgi:CheY-like chemotaxis protein
VAHDLKNIFNPIALNLQVLRRGAAGDRHADEVFARIEDAIRTGSDTVERLRRFSRQEADPAPEPIDLDRVTDAALAICLPRIRERAGIEVRREHEHMPRVLVRPSELVTAIVNLVVNALDAMPLHGTITVRTGADEGGWVEVADDGPGMPPEVQNRVFEPFFTTKPEGTGLGLAMVYAFVHRHGGRVTLDTMPGRGTTVRLWFPPAASRRLLVVEDEAAARQALQMLLQDEGFTVAASPSGEEALACLEVFEPDALLVDFQLPGIDGATLARRARQWRSSLPVVLMSGFDESNDALASLLRTPLTERIDKPIDMDRLVAALEQVLAPAA